MGYNYNKGKFYDASGTRAFCDAMQQAVADYEQYAIDTKTAYTDFDANQKFNGIAAFAMKNLVLFGAGSLLKEVTDLHKQMINDQNYLMANFEETVDANQRARIENDTLEIINKDFKGYYNCFVAHSKGVKSIVDALNSEFGSYAYFKQPDKSAAINSFTAICGGEAEGGYIIGCRDLFLDYDYRMTKYLKGRDTADRSLNLLNRITDTAAFLGGQTYEKPEVTDIKIQELEEAELESGVAGFTATINGWLNNIRNGLEAHLNAAKEIGTEALEGLEKFQDDFYIGSFEALESMDNSAVQTIVASDFYLGFKKIVQENIIEDFYYKNPILNAKKTGAQTLTLIGQELDEGLKSWADKAVDLQPDSPWYYRITNMGIYQMFEIGGAIQSLVQNGDLSEMEKNSMENFNAFQKGLTYGVIEMVTGLFSLPELVIKASEGARDNLGDLANYLMTHDISEIPGDLAAWYGEKKQQAGALWAYFTEEFHKKYYNEDGTLKVTAWYESAGYIVAFIASCFIGSGEANSATKGGAALNSVDDVARGVANMSDDALRVAGEFSDDAARAAGTIDDVARGVTNLEDDAARAVENVTDDLARAAENTTDDVAKAGEKATKITENAVNAVDDKVDDVAKNLEKYLDDIVDETGKVNKKTLRQIRLDVQKGKLSQKEISELSKKMSDLGLTAQYEAEMKKIKIGEYLKNIIGNAPKDMENPHAHHILFKTGRKGVQQDLVKEGQKILRKFGIDPIIGPENLTWAPNIKGKHTTDALKELVEALKKIDEAGGTYDDIVKILKQFGKKAAGK